jgi:general secretion pathway protein G
VSSRASRAARRGFTLLELLVVIAVLAILASLVSPMIFHNVGDAKVTAARTQLETLGLALDAYRLDNDYYPSTAQGLDALVRLPSGEPAPRRWRGPYLKRGVPADPWGRPYAYRVLDGDQYELQSLGRDGTSGGEGEDGDLLSGLGPTPR